MFLFKQFKFTTFLISIAYSGYISNRYGIVRSFFFESTSKKSSEVNRTGILVEILLQ